MKIIALAMSCVQGIWAQTENEEMDNISAQVVDHARGDAEVASEIESIKMAFEELQSSSNKKTGWS